MPVPDLPKAASRPACTGAPRPPVGHAAGQPGLPGKMRTGAPEPVRAGLARLFARRAAAEARHALHAARLAARGVTSATCRAVDTAPRPGRRAPVP